MASFLPSLTAYDPRDGEEGTLDPLGLALGATRVAELLVPGFTERLRRPRFFTALALGSLLFSRREHYPEGVYGVERDGPAYLAWERLVLESFAQSAKIGDQGLLGVPGIQKARDARSAKARLSSQLYLKNPAAVGLWVAYKGLAVDVGLMDKEGMLAEAGERLIGAWVEGTTQPDPRRAAGGRLLADLDDAISPLLGRGPSKSTPHGVWGLLHEKLHPSGMTRPEARVIEALLRDRSDQRERAFAFVERQGRNAADDSEMDELSTLDAMKSAPDRELAWRGRLAATYEALVGQLVSAFNSILFAAGEDRSGTASIAVTLAHAEVGPVFRSAPQRTQVALSEVDAAAQAASEEGQRDATLAKPLRELDGIFADTLSWLRNGALESPEKLFDALLARHFVAQKKKPPDGKRPWIEGSEGQYSVRLRFMQDKAPPADGRLHVHGYRTRAVRSCLRDLRGANR